MTDLQIADDTAERAYWEGWQRSWDRQQGGTCRTARSGSA